jgi:hypothetical protein
MVRAKLKIVAAKPKSADSGGTNAQWMSRLFSIYNAVPLVCQYVVA